MTTQETVQVLSLIFSTYKREFKDHTENDKKVMIGLWTTAFKDKPSALIMAAVEYYIFNDSTGFAPTIGNINNVLQLARDDQLGVAEAWEYLDRASQNSLYYAKREFKKLHPLVQKVIGTPAELKRLAEMDANTFNTTYKREFKREYNALLEEERRKEAGGFLQLHE